MRLCSPIQLPLLGVLLVQCAAAASETKSQIEFFEKRIRPVLVEHCYECHSAESKSIKGELRVDYREALRSGGESGPAVVPGKPDDSLLLAALRHESFEMPPTGKLPDKVIRDFERWIRDGATDPRDGVLAKQSDSIDLESARGFWSFQPFHSVPIPMVKSDWPRTTIDRFILAKLEPAGLQPSKPADPETLARRIFFDLIGLPPTPGQLARYVNDTSPNAIERLIDSLLASPEYGPHWGRHWLDVARYADSSGGGRTRILHDAWRYRDYVIDAFNSDLRYDQFVTEQIAGDLLPSETPSLRGRRLAATGFLALGPTNYELQDKELLRMEVVDEQLDTIGRSLLGMTIGCARCHDHKFDPIPTSDYYALAGIFRSTKSLIHANVSDFVQRELPISAELKARIDQHAKVADELQLRLDRTRQRLKDLVASGKELVAVRGTVIDDTLAELVGDWKHSTHTPRFVQDGYRHDGGENKGSMSARYAASLPSADDYEVRVSYSPGTNRARKVPITIQHADGESTVFIDQAVPPPIDRLFISVGKYRFTKETSATVTIENRDTTGVVIIDAVQFISASLAKQMIDEQDPDATKLAALEADIQRLEGEVNRHKKKMPVTPKVMSVMEEDAPADFHVCIRGNLRNPGDAVPRGFLSVIDQVETTPVSDGESGRRQLAQWICDSRNPLTARVIVNRVWYHLLGGGLVRTPDNFGNTGAAPTHPQLLDHLAIEFVRHEWSIKWLIREITRSRVYQMSSDDNAEGIAADPENRLLWRAHRRRLAAEQIRDAILSSVGNLDRRMKGPAVTPSVNSEFGYEFKGNRRGVYMPIFRNHLLDLFEVFDVADPNIVVGRRNVSTRPTQALFMMNSSFVLENSERLARQLGGLADQTAARKVEWLYARLLGRKPSPVETEETLTFWRDMRDDAGGSSVDAWTAVVQSLLACVDFRYLR